MFSNVTNISYTVHFNWEWVVDYAISSLCSDSGNIKKLCKFSDLSLVQELKLEGHRVKPSYALFRIEMSLNNNSKRSFSIWASSQAFSIVDSKDSLYRKLNEYGISYLMPSTTLLPWDLDSIDDIRKLMNDEDFATSQLVLKSAIGSGGSGIYFVSSEQDVLNVIRNHAKKAKLYEGFIDNLITWYGNVPSWSLQRRINVVTTKNNRKTQVRVYVVICDKVCYIYNQFEVRIPLWNKSKEQFSTGIEDDIINDNDAVPYNQNRDKIATERFLIEEIEELKDSKECIFGTVFKAMQHLNQDLIQFTDDSSSFNDHYCIGIAAIDLVLENHETKQSAYILEFNNNPAMPSVNKQMSLKYKQHLFEFVRGLVMLSIDKKSAEKFNFSIVQ